MQKAHGQIHQPDLRGPLSVLVEHNGDILRGQVAVDQALFVNAGQQQGQGLEQWYGLLLVQRRRVNEQICERLPH